MNFTWDLSRLNFHIQPSTICIDESGHKRAANSPSACLDAEISHTVETVVGEFTFFGTATYLYGDNSHINRIVVDDKSAAVTSQESTQLVGFKNRLHDTRHTVKMIFDDFITVEEAKNAIERVEVTSQEIGIDAISRLIVNESHHLYGRQDSSSSSAAPASSSPPASSSVAASSSVPVSPSAPGNSTAGAPTSPPAAPPPAPPGRHFSVPTIIGVGVGVFVLLGIALATIVWFYFKSTKLQGSLHSQHSSNQYPSTGSGPVPPRIPTLTFPNSFGPDSNPRTPDKPTTKVSFASGMREAGKFETASYDSGRRGSQGGRVLSLSSLSSRPNPNMPFNQYSTSPPSTSQGRLGGDGNRSPSPSLAPTNTNFVVDDPAADAATAPSPTAAVGEKLGAVVDASAEGSPRGDTHPHQERRAGPSSAQQADDLMEYLDDRDHVSGRPPTYRSSDSRSMKPPIYGATSPLSFDAPFVNTHQSVIQKAAGPSHEPLTPGTQAAAEEAEAMSILASVRAQHASPNLGPTRLTVEQRASMEAIPLASLANTQEPARELPPTNQNSTKLPSPPPSRPTSLRPSLVARGISANPAVYAPVRQRTGSETALSESIRQFEHGQAGPSAFSPPSPPIRPHSASATSSPTAEKSNSLATSISNLATAITNRSQNPTASGSGTGVESKKQVRGESGQVLESGWF